MSSSGESSSSSLTAADRAGNGANQVGYGLDGLNVAKGFAGGDVVALCRQVYEHHVAKGVLREIGNADYGGVAIHLYPFMGLGVAAAQLG